LNWADSDLIRKDEDKYELNVYSSCKNTH